MPFGSNSANKMRSISAAVLHKDEIDGWPLQVGADENSDGCPDALTDSRTDGYALSRKIVRGSTPKISGSSKIHKRFLEGDQRYYFVKCRRCREPQRLRWEHEGGKGGIKWDVFEDGRLDVESVRYVCPHCGHPHFEHDKARLFAEGEWEPTAKAKLATVRSYHLSGLYSPPGFKTWAQCVSEYLDAFDVESKQVKDFGVYQKFYNNVLGEPFEVQGSKLTFEQVSPHRRTCYQYGEVPNVFAAEHSGSHVLLLTCQVDVHKDNLAVAVMGWTRNMRCYLVDYFRIEVKESQPPCTDVSSPAWAKLRELVESKRYKADDGKAYKITLTLVDANYATDTVAAFCQTFPGNVVPIMGRERAAKFQRIEEFAEFRMKNGTKGYRILVDHYKDRLGLALRREWYPDGGPQPAYHFNAPIDITTPQLRELTAEIRRRKTDARGRVSYEWHRPGGGNKPNELWDLLVYGHAAVEIIAWKICVDFYKLDTVEWDRFWDKLEKEKLYILRTLLSLYAE